MDMPSTRSTSDSAAAARNKPASASGRCFSIGGLPFLVTASESTAWTVDELFAVAPPHDGPAELTFDVSDAPATEPEGPATETYANMRLWRQGDGLVVDSGYGVYGVVDKHSVRISGAATGRHLAVGIRRVLHYGLAQVLSLNGRSVLHAAVVARDGVGVMLLGSTGAGKSTCTYLAGAAGWDVIADDLVAMWSDGATIWATGVPRALAVPGELLPAHIGDDADALSRDARGRRRVPHELFHGPCRIAAVARVRHGVGDGQLEPATKREIVESIVGAAPAVGHPAVARDAFALAGLLTRGQVWRLMTADTVEGRHIHVPLQLAAMIESQ